MRVWYLMVKPASEGLGIGLFEIMLHYPSQQFFSHVRLFPRLNQFYAEDIVSCLWTQYRASNKRSKVTHSTTKLFNQGSGKPAHKHSLAKAFSFTLRQNTVKPVLSSHSKIDKIKISKTDGSLMQDESIAEYSWSILQYF